VTVALDGEVGAASDRVPEGGEELEQDRGLVASVCGRKVAYHLAG
jgi:hypothetical protein